MTYDCKLNRSFTSHSRLSSNATVEISSFKATQRIAREEKPGINAVSGKMSSELCKHIAWHAGTLAKFVERRFVEERDTPWQSGKRVTYKKARSSTNWKCNKMCKILSDEFLQVYELLLGAELIYWRRSLQWNINSGMWLLAQPSAYTFVFY